jgi:hypothetical protein
MCTLSHDEEADQQQKKNKDDSAGAVTAECLRGWYKSLRFVECVLWIAILVLILMMVSVNVAVTMFSHTPDACDIRLAGLNMTHVCASHCATMFIRRG